MSEEAKKIADELRQIISTFNKKVQEASALGILVELTEFPIDSLGNIIGNYTYGVKCLKHI